MLNLLGGQIKPLTVDFGKKKVQLELEWEALVVEAGEWGTPSHGSESNVSSCWLIFLLTFAFPAGFLFSHIRHVCKALIHGVKRSPWIEVLSKKR